MQIKDFLDPGHAHCDVSGVSKKRILEFIAQQVSEGVPNLDADTVFDSLLERERLGSTGLGNGVAIPHCRLPGCDKTIGLLLKLEQAIDFQAIDKQPVDLVFALLVPDDNPDAHLQTLKAIAERFTQASFRDELRKASCNDGLFQAAVS